MVAKLSVDFRNKLVFDSDFLDLNLGNLTPPVIKLEVDFDNSFISDMVDKSITDLDIFLIADGVKLLSRTSRAASVLNVSGSTFGQI